MSKNKFRSENICLGCFKKVNKNNINELSRTCYCENGCGDFPYIRAKKNSKGKILGEWNWVECANCSTQNEFYFPYKIKEHKKNCMSCKEIAIIIDDTFVQEYLNDIQHNLHILKGGK